MESKAPPDHLFFEKQTIIRFVFILVTIFSSALTYQIVKDGFQVETDLTSVLPRNQRSMLEQAATDKMVELGSSNILLMLSSDRNIESEAFHVSTELHKSGLFKRETIGTEWNLNAKDIAGYRFGLLSKNSRRALEEKRYDELKENAYSNIYSLTSNISSTIPVTRDPLGLFSDWYASGQTGFSEVYEDGGLLWIDHHDSTRSAVIILSLKESALNLGYQERVDRYIQKLINELPDDINTYRSGLLFHSAKTASKSKHEVQIVAVGSITGIILLFIWAYRSTIPLVCSLLAIGFGCFAAIAIVHTFFNGIHIFTLVFGASLIGIAIDYCLHFFAWHYQFKKNTNSLTDIFPEMLVGLVTTVIAASCLWFSSLTGLKQIAAFSATGLISSWLFVMAIFPLLPNRRSGYQPKLLNNLAIAGIRLWKQISYRKLVILVLLAGLTAIWFVATRTEISLNSRALHTPSPQLIFEEEHINSVLAGRSPTHYFLVSESSVERLLIQEENLGEELKKLVEREVILGFDAISNYWPSEHYQRENYALLEGLHSEINAKELMRDLGLNEKAIKTYFREFATAVNNPLTSDVWRGLDDPRITSLWLGKVSNEWASIITLRGITDLEALRSIADKMDQVLFIDQVERLDKSLQLQQDHAMKILMVAYIVVTAIISIYHRVVTAALIVATPLLSTALTLAILSYFDVHLSLFHFFGLFLVLGLGLDYGIFLNSPRKNESRCLAAIFLSALTSCLSFGLLSFSSTPMISAFGVTVLLGSVFNLTLVPAFRLILVGPVKATNQAEPVDA